MGANEDEDEGGRGADLSCICKIPELLLLVFTDTVLLVGRPLLKLILKGVGLIWWVDSIGLDSQGRRADTASRIACDLGPGSIAIPLATHYRESSDHTKCPASQNRGIAADAAVSHTQTQMRLRISPDQAGQ